MAGDNNGRETSRPWVDIRGLPQRLLDSLVVLTLLSLMTFGVGWLSEGHLVETLGGVTSEGKDYTKLKSRVCALEKQVGAPQDESCRVASGRVPPASP